VDYRVDNRHSLIIGILAMQMGNCQPTSLTTNYDAFLQAYYKWMQEESTSARNGLGALIFGFLDGVLRVEMIRWQSNTGSNRLYEP
jgi:hypothetical protein